MVSHCYNYDKATMLNVAYDVFDTIGAFVQHVNSDRGTIVFQMGPKIHLRMIFEVKYPKKETLISFLNEASRPDLNENEQQCAQMIFEEIDAKLHAAHTM